MTARSVRKYSVVSLQSAWLDVNDTYFKERDCRGKPYTSLHNNFALSFEYALVSAKRLRFRFRFQFIYTWI